MQVFRRRFAWSFNSFCKLRRPLSPGGMCGSSLAQTSSTSSESSDSALVLDPEEFASSLTSGRFWRSLTKLDLQMLISRCGTPEVHHHRG